MHKIVTVFLFFIFNSLFVFSQNKYTISGTIADSANSETAIGALVYIKGTSIGLSTNEYGFYSLTLPEGKYDITISFLGYKTQTHSIDLKSNLSLNSKLSSSDNVLKEIVISAEATKEKEQIRSTQMSAINIPIEQIKNIPTLGGETDIIKVMQLMPGVKRGGEGQNQMFVRGGSGDDNLILLDEAVVYNVSHLFGFFSVFNNDALKDVTLIKGGFPAQYGGRLSSVMDIHMKDGDAQKFHVDGGIGILSSHLTLQGPIIKDRMSFIVSGRRSYIDQMFKLIYKTNILPYYFYDVTCKLNYRLSDKDRLYLSTYYGDDVLAASQTSDSSFFDGGFRLGNITSTLRWNHLYNQKLFSNLSLIYTRFRYDVEAFLPGNSFLAKSKISDVTAKYDFSYYKKTGSIIRFGGIATNHAFRPNVVNTSGDISALVKSRDGNLINTQEVALYANHEYDINARLKINYGLRLPMLYTQQTIYVNPEPRFSSSYLINEKQSIKFSYSQMHQYLHLVSSSAIALPTDLWYPVTKKIKPLQSDQIALGYNYLFEKIKTTISVEAYYKHMKNLIEYREGAVLLLNDNYEDELVKGKGDAYGVELFVQKTAGKFTGWVGYTISWSTRKFDELNNGKMFYAKNDRRHDLSIVASYEFTKRITTSVVWVYSSGQRFTPITGYFSMPNSSLTQIDLLPIYAEKNSVVLPSSHRLDVSVILKSKLKRKWMKWVGEWHLGAYNFYNRAQPYRVEVAGNEDGTFKYQAKGLFGFIPFVAYNFKF